MSGGDTVMIERVDHVELQGGKAASLRAMATFEIREGKIAVWRDYYDMFSFRKQLSQS